jgi:hypothetical protein
MPSIGQWADKCVKPQTELVRSGPIYVETNNGTITLVKEGYAPMGSAGEVQPIALYVIDAKSVRRVSLARSNRKRLLLLLASLLIMCTALWLLRPKH